MSNAIALDDIGTHGHNKGTRVYPRIDGAELNATHAHASKLAQVDELDAGDVAEGKGDLGRRTTRSEDYRHELEQHDEGTYRSEPEDSNVRDTPSGAPKNNGPAPKNRGSR